MLQNKIDKSLKSTRNLRKSFSLPIALTPKKTLLIGAGAVAWQKFKVLQDSQWEVCVWAREICDKRFMPYFTEFNKNNLSLRGESMDSPNQSATLSSLRGRIADSHESRIDSVVSNDL